MLSQLNEIAAPRPYKIRGNPAVAPLLILVGVQKLIYFLCNLHVPPVLSLPPAVLHGLDLESEHCMFESQNGKVTLVPLGRAQCSVNGVQVTEPMALNQGTEKSETSDVSSAALNV